MLFKIFPNLSTFWNIALLAVFCLLAVYFLLFITNIIFIFSFKRMISRDSKAVRVALSTKLDVLKNIQVLLEKEGISFSEESAHSLRYLDVEDFVKLDTEDAAKAMEELTSIDTEYKSIISKNNKLTQRNDFVIVNSLLNENNQALKFSLLRYNADVLGYNYWVRFPPFIYIHLLWRLKLKKTI